MSHRLRRAPIVALASLSLLGTAAVSQQASAAVSGGLDIPGTILRTGDYDTGSTSQWSGSQSLRSYSLQVQNQDVRQGSYAARFEVRNGDDPLCAAGWGCFGDRSEVQMSTGESEGKERWYSWSTKFDASFPRYPNWQVVSQWHADADGSPPLGFYAENDDLVLVAHRFSSPGNPIDIVNIWRGPMRRGEWQDIKLHVKWSGSDSVGFVELWIDNVPQVLDNGQTRRSIRTLYPGYSAYFKQGYYRQAGLSQPGIIYHDGFRMSDGVGDTVPSPDPAPAPAPPPSTTTPDPPATTPPATSSIPALGQAVPQGNLTPNPAFASGLSNWGAWQGTAQTATAADGAPVALVTRASGDAFALDDSTPSVAAPATGAQYTAVAWVRAANAQSIGKQARVYARQLGQQDVAGSAVTLSSAWQKSTVTITARSATGLDARVGFAGAVAGDAMNVGMISVAPAAASTTPAPTTPTTPAPPASGTTLVSDGFEGTSPFATRVGAGNRFSVVTSPVRTGARAGSFEQAGSGSQASISTTFAAQSDVTASASVYVASNSLGVNRSRSIMRVMSGTASNGPRHEVGIFRDSRGAMHWALWSVGKTGNYTLAALGAAPKVGQWQTLKLQTQWNRSGARAKVVIDGTQVLSPAAVDLSGVRADTVEMGLNYSNPADKAKVVLDDVSVTTDPYSATTAGGVSAARSAAQVGPFSAAMIGVSAPVRAVHGKQAAVAFAAPARARATVTVRRGATVLATASRTTAAGLNRLGVRMPRARGLYTVTVTVGGGSSTTTMRVV